MTAQRDFGDRVSRRHARLKYTIGRMDPAEVIAEVERRSGVEFELQRPVKFTSQGDRHGWIRYDDGSLHLTLRIENGRIEDRPNASWMTGLREITQRHIGGFRMTPDRSVEERFGDIVIRVGLVEPVLGPPSRNWGERP